MAAADRRAAILEAARVAFAEGSYHEISLDSVAERAGVSKALLYEHFDSKRELYAAMLEMHTQDLVGRIGAAVGAAEPGEPRLLAGLNAFLDFVQDRRGGWRVIFRNAGDPDVAAWLAELRDGVAAAVATLMSEEAEQGLPGRPRARGDAADVRPAAGRRDPVARRLVGAAPRRPPGAGPPGRDGLRLDGPGPPQPGRALAGLGLRS